MPKRKSSSADLSSAPPPSLASYDAALDLLACETFGRLQVLTSKFETAAGVKLNEGVVKHRWEEAVKRYWVMKSMDDLTCGASGRKEKVEEVEMGGEVAMGDGDEANGHGRDRAGYERPLPNSHHPGVVVAFGLDQDEETQWRRWSPKVYDLVLVELPNGGGIWPGKIIEKKLFFQGRTIPRGNHFFPVRVYNEDIPPTVTVKSRLVPFHLRQSPPLLASTSLLSAYHHAANPMTFDMLAATRESAAAHVRAHPGVNTEGTLGKIKTEKDQWKKFVNWLMDERRVEKLRTLGEERERRLKAVASSCPDLETTSDCDGEERDRKRRVTLSVPPFGYTSSRSSPSTTLTKMEGDVKERGGIFRIAPIHSPSPMPNSAQMNGSGSRLSPMASYIRPAITQPIRSNSPRRADRRRGGMFAAIGELSPRNGRGGTYTPPRVLPSGDETASYAASPPSLKSFDFVSPLGSGHVKFGKCLPEPNGDLPMATRNCNLETVQEEKDDEGKWTVVAPKTRSKSRRGEADRSKRAGSAPCETAQEPLPQGVGMARDDIVL